MSKYDRLILFVLPVGLVATPCISLASDTNFCKRQSLEECLAQLSPNLCGAIKRACEKKQSMVFSRSTVSKAEYTVYKTPSVSAPTSDNLGSPPAQHVFIRADKLDNPYPGLTSAVSAGQALGASVSYTGNNFVQTKTGSTVVVSNSQSVTIAGLASYTFLNQNQPWELGPIGDEKVDMIPSLWVSGNGNWDQPTKAFGDTSAVKAGGEFDFRFSPIAEQVPGSSYWELYAGVAPFYQTDLYGQASAGGVTFSLTPFNRGLFFIGFTAPIRRKKQVASLTDFWRQE
jgi:hypothetical protein